MFRTVPLFALTALLTACSPRAVTNNGSPAQQIGGNSSANLTTPVRGGSDGGGGDTILPWADSAWFIGKNRTIKSCYQRASDFGLSDSQVQTAIRSAYSVWTDYLKTKTGHENATTDFNLPTQVQIANSCSGTEDLVFYFGIDDKKTEAAKSEHLSPIAYAKRNNYDTFIWDSGFIWIAGSAEATRLLETPWTEPLLIGALTHEIGHTLGCGHVSGTIMRANILEFLKQSVGLPVALQTTMLSTVDWDDDLIENGFNFNYLGKVENFAGNQDAEKYSKRYFFELMGRDSVGTVYSRLWRTDEDFHLVVVDAKGQKDFVLDKNIGIAGVKRQKTVFKRYIPRPTDKYFPPALDDQWEDVMFNKGIIHSETGTEMEFVLQRGGGFLGAWEVQLFPASGGQWTVFAKVPGGLSVEDYEKTQTRVRTLNIKN